jgi:3-oxoacyl-[acyl-carrier protein] reductase
MLIQGLDPVKFKSKVVVITGSAANIGKAAALKFAAQGAKIVVNAKNNVSGGEQVKKEIISSGGEAIFIQADVSDFKQVDKLFAQTIKQFGTVDILINNAGNAIGMPTLESTKDHWSEVFDDNLFSSVLCSIAAAKLMKHKGGHIINTASIRGLPHGGRAGISAYSAAKAALINFTKTLAKELAPDILVNAVAPGFTLTSAFDTVPEAMKKDFINSTLLKKWITPDEIADAFIYLAGSQSITGEVLVVDAGWNA